MLAGKKRTTLMNMIKLNAALGIGMLFTTLAHAYSAKISYLSGDVQVGRGEHFEKAELNRKVLAGEFIKTGKDAIAILTTEDESQLKLKANSELQLSDPKSNEVFLKSGGLFSKITKGAETHFHVKTATATMGVRGTRFYTSYGDEKQKDDVWMCVNEGLVAVEAPDQKPVLVKEGLGVYAPPRGKKVSEPKPFAWTKDLNWNMDPAKGDVVDHSDIKAAYGDLLKQNYD